MTGTVNPSPFAPVTFTVSLLTSQSFGIFTPQVLSAQYQLQILIPSLGGLLLRLSKAPDEIFPPENGAYDFLIILLGVRLGIFSGLFLGEGILSHSVPFPHRYF